MEPKKITFKADRVIVKSFRTDRSFRVELDTGEYEIKAMQELLGLPEGVYKIEITPVIEAWDGAALN